MNGITKHTARRGRAARKSARIISATPDNPAAPGQTGGHYKPLTDDECDRIIDAALDLLSSLGMAEAPDILVEAASAKGAFVSDLGRLCFPRMMVGDIVSRACRSFVYYGRDSGHDFEVGGDKVYFGTGGAAVQTLDINTGLYRPSTLRDLYDFTRLQDTLTNISWFTRCCVATDISDLKDLDINTAYALLRGTTKPVGTSFTIADTVDPVVDLFDHALGGAGKFAERPFCKAHISPVISPMRYGEDAVEVTRACIRRKVPINSIIAAQSGATAPATPAGFLAQSTAETLAGLILVNVFSPGYPVIFSNWPLIIDLRSGAFSGGGGESSMLNAAAAQISNRLGLPSGVASSMADAKAVDAQMGAEKALSALACGLSGANMIYESAGMTASLLGASFEAFILDDEMLGHVHRTIRGIEVTDESIGLKTIREATLGEGHFLGCDDTIASMSRDYFYPDLADRDPPVTWEEKGAKNARDTAREKAREILARPDPGYLSNATDAWARDRFNIVLP